MGSIEHPTLRIVAPDNNPKGAIHLATVHQLLYPTRRQKRPAPLSKRRLSSVVPNACHGGTPRSAKIKAGSAEYPSILVSLGTCVFLDSIETLIKSRRPRGGVRRRPWSAATRFVHELAGTIGAPQKNRWLQNKFRYTKSRVEYRSHIVLNSNAVTHQSCGAARGTSDHDDRDIVAAAWMISSSLPHVIKHFLDALP